MRRRGPMIWRVRAIETCSEDICWLIDQFVGLNNAMPTDHADNKATFGLICACLQLKLTLFESSLLLLVVKVSLLEDRQ